MHKAGTKDILANMKASQANFETLRQANYEKTGSDYCFNTNNIQTCA